MRRYLERLGPMLDSRDPRDDPVDVLEGWFEMLGRLGTAGRAAIPRLEGCRTHPNPWVRMWAAEALEKIVPTSRR